jgi:osmotically-inducible protein OsmY
MTESKKHQDSPTRTHTADTRNPDWDKYAPEGHGRTDEQIRADVHQALRGEDGRDTTALSISVGDGIVTLSGRVDDRAEQQRILELIRRVPSVKDVRDELRTDS